MRTETNVGEVTAETTNDAEINDVLHSCGSALTCSPLPLVAVEGREYIVRYVNPALCHLVSKEAKELTGRPFALVVPEGEENGCVALLGRVYRTGATETLTDQEHAPALLPGVYWSYVAWPILDASQRPAGVMMQITDTTEQTLARQKLGSFNQNLLLSGLHQLELRETAEALNVRLQALATTDGLTGLNNHRAFQELLHAEVERTRRYNTPLSLLMLDVDDFKHYNDAFGHPAGDTVLRKIGEVLQATARINDLTARYGGEEFAVILIETDRENAEKAAERFRVAIEKVSWQERGVTISVGAATLSQTAHDPVTLIAEADIALYHSKARGRNCATHSADVYNVEDTPPAPRL